MSEQPPSSAAVPSAAFLSPGSSHMTDGTPLPTLVTEPLGGSALARAAVTGHAPAEWYLPRPTSAEGWRAHARAVADEFPDGRWLETLRPAIAPGGAAAARLERVAREGGVLVTTGQQPGLFGGPMLTWVKAMSAIALADELEARTGVPTAPLFWAATDDADFEEARAIRVAHPGGVVRLAVTTAPEPGTPMSDAPLGDLRGPLDALHRASGSAASSAPLEAVRDAYAAGGTIGDAYVALLRRLLEPLGMAVLDASHPAARAAARPVLERVAIRGAAVASAVAARSAAIEEAGYAAQVQEVAGLSLVVVYEDGRKRRLPLREAAGLRPEAELGTTVLVRPVVERAILPTVAYCAGPGEIAYFAQSSAVADALELARPLVVPRWSVTVVEPHVQRLLERLGIERDELRTPSAVEARLARASMPEAVVRDLANLRDGIERGLAALEIDDAEDLVPSASVQGTRRSLLHRLERLERRFVSAIKRRETTLMHDVATAAGALFPDGKRQERALSFIPMLAREGLPLVEAMLAEARRHARALIGLPAGTARNPAETRA